MMVVGMMAARTDTNRASAARGRQRAKILDIARALGPDGMQAMRRSFESWRT